MEKLFDVIKYEGDNSSLVWKHPIEDFNIGSQLIVHEGQEALFFVGGHALDLFRPGRHTLKPESLPILGKLVKLVAGGETPFHSEVYFINKTVQMSLKWGTDSKVKYIDPQYGIPMEIGASGEMNLAVSDSRVLLEKLVGTMKGISWSDEGNGFTQSIRSSFRPLILETVKTNLSAAIKSKNINPLEFDENLEVLSDVLRNSMLAGFEEYGLTIPQFYITNIVLPENDPAFRRLKDLYSVELQKKMVTAETAIKTAQAAADAEIVAANRKAELERQLTQTEIAKSEAERELIRAQLEAQTIRLSGLAEAEVMAAKGYTQRDVFSADVQKAYAESLGTMTINGGNGSIASDMIGLSVGMAAANKLTPQIGEMFNGMTPPTTAPAAKCAKCGATLPAGAKFCLECGEKVVGDDQVVCPSCGKTIAKGKFCPECGYKFVTVCPACGKNVTAGAKFCAECGEKL